MSASGSVPRKRDISRYTVDSTKKRDGLRKHTASVTQCAWPNCDKSDPESFDANRVGVLCLDHAWSHYDAMNEVLVLDGKYDMDKIRELRAREDREQVEAQDRRHRGNQPGWVYYVEIGDRIKVGYSADVRRRMRAYPPGSLLLAVEPGDTALERQRHRQFAEHLTDGREWFNPDPQLLDHIRALTDLHGHPQRYAHEYRKPQRPEQQRQPMKYVRARRYR